ncbi:hypothetical protein HDU96_008947, partial [Phlyctochytrium bullatum]
EISYFLPPQTEPASKKRLTTVKTSAMPYRQVQVSHFNNPSEGTTPAAEKVDSAISLSPELSEPDSHLDRMVTLTHRQLRDVVNAAVAEHTSSLRRTIYQMARAIDEHELEITARVLNRLETEACRKSLARPAPNIMVGIGTAKLEEHIDLESLDHILDGFDAPNKETSPSSETVTWPENVVSDVLTCTSEDEYEEEETEASCDLEQEEALLEPEPETLELTVTPSEPAEPNASAAPTPSAPSLSQTPPRVQRRSLLGLAKSFAWALTPSPARMVISTSTACAGLVISTSTACAEFAIRAPVRAASALWHIREGGLNDFVADSLGSTW